MKLDKLSRSYIPVSLKFGESCNEARHFKGAAREVFKYLKHLADKTGGFAWPRIKTITARSKNWSRDKQPYSIRQVKRILKDLQRLRVISPWTKVKIKGRSYEGWQIIPHGFWAHDFGGCCDFKFWDEFSENDESCKSFSCVEYTGQNVTSNVTPDVTSNVTENEIMSPLMSPIMSPPPVTFSPATY